MRPRQVPPPPELSDAVQCLWMADRTFSENDPSFELLPDHNIELILSFGGKAWIESKGLRRDLPNVYVLGLLDQPMRYGADGRVRTVAARFHAWGFAPLFGLDWRALPRPLVTPDVDWHGLLRDTQAVLDDPDPERVVAPLLTFLLDRARKHKPSALTPRLRRAAPAGRVETLAQSVAYSPRQVQRTFARSVGVTPKRLAQLARFTRVRDALAQDPLRDLGDLAAAEGYADQAHLTREFRRFGEKTPRQFAGEMQGLRAALTAEQQVVFFQDVLDRSS